MYIYIYVCVWTKNLGASTMYIYICVCVWTKVLGG